MAVFLKCWGLVFTLVHGRPMLCHWITSPACYNFLHQVSPVQSTVLTHGQILLVDQMTKPHFGCDLFFLNRNLTLLILVSLLNVTLRCIASKARGSHTHRDSSLSSFPSIVGPEKPFQPDSSAERWGNIINSFFNTASLYWPTYKMGAYNTEVSWVLLSKTSESSNIVIPTCFISEEIMSKEVKQFLIDANTTVRQIKCGQTPAIRTKCRKQP